MSKDNATNVDMSKDNATNRGKIAENEFFNNENKVEKLISIINVDLHTNHKSDDLEYIDSKSKHCKELRKKLTKQYKKTHTCFKGINSSSSKKGDFALPSSIIDNKDYEKINGLMKFPEIFNLNDYIKGVDSNIKYLKLANIDEITNIINKIFNNSIDGYTKPTLITKIKNDKFINIVKIFEFGFAYDSANIENKYFINKNGNHKIKKLNLIDHIDIDVDVYFWISPETGYMYFLFYEDDKCTYILSERNNFKSNCSFIHKDKLTEIGQI